MELWNELMANEIESISLRDIAWILYCNQLYEEDMEIMKDNDLSENAFKELVEYIKKENEYDKSGRDIEDRFASDSFDNYYKECRKKLNVMCEAIFDHTYNEIWEKTGKGYKFDVPFEASFIEYLIYIEALDVGKNIREGKYKDIDEIIIKEIMSGVETLCQNSKFKLDKEKSLNNVRKKFWIIAEYDDLKQAINDLQFYINNVILKQAIDESYYDGYRKITKMLEDCESKVTNIWEGCAQIIGKEGIEEEIENYKKLRSKIN